MGQGLYLRLRTLPDLSRQFRDSDRVSIAIVIRIFVRRATPSGPLLRTSQLADVPQPDPHVWDLQGNVSLENPGSCAVNTRILRANSRRKRHEQHRRTRRRARPRQRIRERRARPGNKVGRADGHGAGPLRQDRLSLGSFTERSGRQPGVPGFNSIANAMTNNESGVREFNSPAGSYLAAYSPVPQLNVAVAVARDRSALLSSAHRVGNRRIGVGAAARQQAPRSCSNATCKAARAASRA